MQAHDRSYTIFFFLSIDPIESETSNVKKMAKGTAVSLIEFRILCMYINREGSPRSLGGGGVGVLMDV